MLLLSACESPAVSTFPVLQTAPDVLALPSKILVWKLPLDDYKEYDNWFQTILKARKPAFVIIDEPGSLGKGKAESYPPNYRLLLKQGRSMFISAISMTQEATYIPRQTTGQTSHLIRFHLMNDDDILASARLPGVPQYQKLVEPP